MLFAQLFTFGFILYWSLYDVLHHTKGGNSWSSGPAPPPPPGTSPSGKHSHSSGGGNIPSDGSGGEKSGVSGGVAGIVISLLLVGAIIAFFIVKKRSQRRSLSNVEKLDNQPFATPTAMGFHGILLLFNLDNNLQFQGLF